MTKELPLQLPSLSDALRGVQEELQKMPTAGPQPVPQPDEIPLTIRLMREARLKDEIKKAEKEKRRRELEYNRRYTKAGTPRKKRKHYTQLRRDGYANTIKNYRTKLYSRYSRWKRRSRTKAEGIEMTFEEFASFWGRINPWTGKPVFMTKKFVRWTRLDNTKPWRVDNIHPSLQIGRRTIPWLKMELPTNEEL